MDGGYGLRFARRCGLRFACPLLFNFYQGFCVLKKTNLRWLLKIVIISLVASIVFTLVSVEILGRVGYIISFGVLALFIVVGIIFDIIGVAVAAANEAPFNAMATRRQRGATEALLLIKNAEKVTCYTNDVVGDVTGIISGTTAALIAARLVEGQSTENFMVPVLISAVVTGVTIGGKAIGKTLAFNKNVAILHTVGKMLNFLRLKPFAKQGKTDKQLKSEKNDSVDKAAKSNKQDNYAKDQKQKEKQTGSGRKQ